MIMAYKYLQILVLVVLLANTPHCMSEMSTEMKNTIEKGLEAGKVIAEALKDGEFRDSLVKLGKNLAPFLGALGPLVGIALAFIPEPDSAELVYMKEKFAEVNNKLDIMTSEFAEVKNAIDWSAVTVSYGVYERKIQSAEEHLNRIQDADPEHSKGPKDDFLNSYNYDFDNSLQKLYDAIMYNDHVFSKNILEAVKQQTKNYKKKYEAFSKGLLQLLVQGLKVKVSAYHIKKYSSQTIQALEEEWQEKMEKLTSKLSQVDDRIKSAYHTQLKIDADDIILRHHGLGNKGLLKKIYHFLVAKYDWRYWFVAVYDDVYGHDKHTISVCGGYNILHTQGKNVIIASQDKTTAASTQQKLKEILEAVDSDIDGCHLRDPDERALSLVNRTGEKLGNSCGSAALRMAVETGNGLWHISWNSHRAYREIEKTKRCCWGGFWGHCRSVKWRYSMILFA